MMNAVPAPPDLHGSTRRADPTFRALALAAGAMVLVILALIAWSTTKEAWPAFRKEGFAFFTGTLWSEQAGTYRAFGFVWGTLVSATIAIILAVPVSVGIALFVNEVAPPWLRRPTVYVLDLLAVIPSVVFGLWGLNILAPKLTPIFRSIANHLGGAPVIGHLFKGPISGTGLSFMTAGMVLAIMITPIITSLTREVFATVPRTDKEGALALGATRWEMIRGAVFPHSRTGVVGAVMLGLGRAMGETIAAALVIGGATPQITTNLFKASDSMPAVIARQFGEATGEKRAALIGLGVALFLLTIVVNLSANAIVTRANRRSAGS
jgi:phosphate transport system permease protein